VTAIAAAIATAAYRHNISPEVRVIAIASAAALMGIDVYYVAKRVIAPIYLSDAIAEAVLIIAWLIVTFA
jgi:hypothetical protein